MTYLLDTNVVSELRKRAPDRSVLAWYDTTPSSEIFLSVLTVGEIRLGIERLRRKDTVQADVLDRWLHGLLVTYRDRIIDVDVNVVEEWGRLNVPDPLPIIDGMLAASAKTPEWTLVTRNTAHMVHTGVKLLNPFDQAADE